MGGVNTKPFLQAAASGDSDRVAELLCMNVSVREEDNNGNTALYYAAMHGHTHVMRLLMDAGAPIDKKNVIWSTALHAAAERGQIEAVRLLLERGAAVHPINKKGKRPIDLVSSFDDGELIQLLRAQARREKEDKRVDKIDKKKTNESVATVSASMDEGPLSTIEQTPTPPISPPTKKSNGTKRVVIGSVERKKHSLPATDSNDDRDGNTTLHFAARSGRMDAVMLVLATGSSLDERNKLGITPLLYAVHDGYIDVVCLLLGAGANVAIKDARGNTALHVAAMRGYVEMVEVLLARGASVRDRNNDGKTPLEIANEKNHTSVAQRLRKTTMMSPMRANPAYY